MKMLREGYLDLAGGLQEGGKIFRENSQVFKSKI
jgi:hypothetical protein